MRNLAHVHHPRSIEEALALLADGDGQARPLAGGTSLVFSVDPHIRALVDLSRAGLDAITLADGHVGLGAMVTARAVQTSAAVAEAGLEGLREAAGACGSRRLQHQITVGGNVVGVVAWSDLPPMLLALDATFHVRRDGGARDLSALDLFARHPTHTLAPAELLTEVRVPRRPAGGGAAFLKLGRTAVDGSLCDVAVALEIRERAITRARVAVGALRPLPRRLPAAEAALVGAEATAAVFARAARAGRDEAAIASDQRTTRAYRRELCEVLLRRGLAAAAARALGQEAPCGST
jgi:aerobic carbon-monoxide dehydrogenase medium subunit